MFHTGFQHENVQKFSYDVTLMTFWYKNDRLDHSTYQSNKKNQSKYITYKNNIFFYYFFLVLRNFYN